MAGYNEDGTPRLSYDESGNVVGYSGMNSGVTAPTNYTQAVANQNVGQNQLLLGPGWDTPNWADWSIITGGNGTKYATQGDYYKDLYGGGEVRYATDPNGGNQYAYFDPMGLTPDLSKQLTSNPKDSMLGQLVLAGILGTAAAGLTGALPGTESVFGGAGGAGAGEAAWGVNPTFTGGASGGTVAGATGGGAVGGLGAAEAAGLGGAGLGAADALSLAGEAPWWSAGMPSTAQTLGGVSGALDAALPLSAASAGGLAAAAGGAAGAAGATSAATSAAGSALGRIIDGTATAGDYAQVLGGAAAAGLGAYGSSQQANAYSDIANKYLDLGKPYRDLLQQSYQPGFSMANQPDFQNALDIGAQAAARATSAKAGNPVDNPGAYAEMQKYISGSLALPQLNTYRSQLGTFGNLGVNTAGTNDTNSAAQTGGIYNSLGYGLGQITQPDNPLKGILSQLGNNGYKMNMGLSLA